MVTLSPTSLFSLPALHSSVSCPTWTFSTYFLSTTCQENFLQFLPSLTYFAYLLSSSFSSHSSLSHPLTKHILLSWFQEEIWEEGGLGGRRSRGSLSSLHMWWAFAPTWQHTCLYIPTWKKGSGGASLWGTEFPLFPLSCCDLRAVGGIPLYIPASWGGEEHTHYSNHSTYLPVYLPHILPPLIFPPTTHIPTHGLHTFLWVEMELWRHTLWEPEDWELPGGQTGTVLHAHLWASFAPVSCLPHTHTPTSPSPSLPYPSLSVSFPLPSLSLYLSYLYSATPAILEDCRHCLLP